jgi:hypothetical protein
MIPGDEKVMNGQWMMEGCLMDEEGNVAATQMQNNITTKSTVTVSKMVIPMGAMEGRIGGCRADAVPVPVAVILAK